MGWTCSKQGKVPSISVSFRLYAKRYKRNFIHADFNKRDELSPSTPPRLQNRSLIGIKNELDKRVALSLCGLAPAQSQMDLCIDTRETNKGLAILTNQNFCNFKGRCFFGLW